MSNDESIQFSASIDVRQDGAPRVRVIDDGEKLQIYPAEFGALCMFFTPGGWRKLNAAVERAIESSKTAVEAAAR